MALFDPFRNLIHDAAQGLIDAQVTTKVSDMSARSLIVMITCTRATIPAPTMKPWGK